MCTLHKAGVIFAPYFCTGFTNFKPAQNFFKMCYCTSFVDDCINYQNLPLAILYSFCRERINNLVQNNVPVIDLTIPVSFCDGQHAAGRSVFVRYQTIARASLCVSSFDYYLYLFCSLPFLLSILYHTV